MFRREHGETWDNTVVLGIRETTSHKPRRTQLKMSTLTYVAKNNTASTPDKLAPQGHTAQKQVGSRRKTKTRRASTYMQGRGHPSQCHTFVCFFRGLALPFGRPQHSITQSTIAVDAKSTMT